LASLLDLATSSALEAAALVGRPTRRPEVAATKSSPTDVVTQIDRDAERLLTRLLLTARPNDGLLGEENGHLPGTSGLTWVVDPIDGTVNYVYGLPAYAVSVALVRGDPMVEGGWAPLAGCVTNAATGETWTAARGGGAWLGETRLRMPDPPPLASALLATGFGYDGARRATQASVLAVLLAEVRDVRRWGSAALDLCHLAAGRLDGYYERGLNAWDYAAGALVVSEAGGQVLGLRGGPPGAAMTVAARAPLAQELVERLEALEPPDGGVPDTP
jgi:myo-inositol-1(or 4)-monophosphatase